MAQIIKFEGKEYRFADDITDSEIKSYLSKQIEDEGVSASDFVRAAGQGFTFGFGDEIEAFFTSAFSDKTYDEAKAESLEKLEQFRSDSPGLAYGTEIAASLPSLLIPGAGLARAGQLGTKATQAIAQAPQLARTVGGAALGGGLYGAGTAEDMASIPESALSGALISGGIGGAAGVALPRIGSAAKDLISKGVDLTPGQAMGGLPSVIERGMSASPFMGRAIESATKRASADVGNVVINKALEPIKASIPKGVSGFSAVKAAEDALDEAYKVATENASLSFVRGVTDKMIQAPKNVVGLTKDSMDNASQIVKNIISNDIGAKKLSGEKIKEIDSLIGKTARAYLAPTNAVSDKNIGRGLMQAQKVFRDEMVKQNPKNQAILDAHKAFQQLIPIQKATNKAIVEGGEFSPNQLLAAMRTQAPKKTASGSAEGQDLAMTASDIIGSTSGSSLARPILEQSIIAASLLNPLATLPVVAGLGAGSGLYSKPVVGALRTGLAGTGEGLRRAAPAMGGLLATE